MHISLYWATSPLTTPFSKIWNPCKNWDFTKVFGAMVRFCFLWYAANIFVWKNYREFFQNYVAAKCFFRENRIFWKLCTFFRPPMIGQIFLDFFFSFCFFRMCCDDPDEKILLENLFFMSEKSLEKWSKFRKKSIFSDIFLLWIVRKRDVILVPRLY